MTIIIKKLIEVIMKATATEMKTHFGHYLDIASQGVAVIVERSGKAAAALVDYAEYQYLKQLDEIILLEKIKLAEEQGYLSDDESEDFLKTALKRLSHDIKTQTE